MYGIVMRPRILILSLALAFVVGSALAAGCAPVSSTTGAKQPTGAAAHPSAGGMKGVTASTTGTTDPSVQTCAECGGKGMGKPVAGTAVVRNGVQVVSIAIQGGYYVPNTFTAKSGLPIQVVVTGKAKGCIAKPTFKSLGKRGDVTASGVATIDLGTLKPGVYTFTCAMGMSAGTITVE